MPADDPRKATIKADIESLRAAVDVPPGVRFQVLDCFADGFVHRGSTIVLSVRLTRLNAAQRFFIVAHEYAHLKLAHRAAMSSFVARIVSGLSDEERARAAVTSALASHSHQAELDADALAVQLMRDAGHDPQEAARLFDSIGEGEDNRTHPSSGRRARAIRALL